jgi:hypothetical protein
VQLGLIESLYSAELEFSKPQSLKMATCKKGSNLTLSGSLTRAIKSIRLSTPVLSTSLNMQYSCSGLFLTISGYVCEVVTCHSQISKNRLNLSLTGGIRDAQTNR